MASRESLRRQERRKERTKRVIRSSSSTLRRLSQGTGLRESDVRHYATDRVELSPFFRDMEGLWLLAKGRCTDPTPELVELEVLVLEGHFDSRSSDELLRMVAEEMDAEHDDEARENRASQHRNLDDYIDALKDEARRQMRIAAMLEVLRDRGIDPFKARN